MLAATRTRPDVAGIVATGDLSDSLAALPVRTVTPPSITVVLNWEEALEH